MPSNRLAILAAAITGLVVAAALLAYLVSSTGDDQGNQAISTEPLCGPEPTGVISYDSLTRFPNYREFETLAEVEATAGFAPPEIHAPGWSFFSGMTMPYDWLGNLPGSEIGGVYLFYTCNETILQLSITREEELTAWAANVTPVEIDGRRFDRVELPGPARVILEWREDGRGYSAVAVPGEGFGEEEIYEVIGSLD